MYYIARKMEQQNKVYFLIQSEDSFLRIRLECSKTSHVNGKQASPANLKLSIGTLLIGCHISPVCLC